MTDELIPQSDAVFVERFSGVRLTFSRNANGRFTGFRGSYRRQSFSYDRVPEEPQ